MIVIDQHALHERVLYEQLRERVLSGTLETQRLLVPEAVDLSPAEAAAALANHDLLAKLGVEVSAFGGDTVLVTSYPAMLANFRPADVLHDLVARLTSGGKSPERRDLIDDLLHMISAKPPSRRAIGSRRKRSLRWWKCGTWPRIAIIARTAGRRRWCSRGKSWIGSFYAREAKGVRSED